MQRTWHSVEACKVSKKDAKLITAAAARDCLAPHVSDEKRRVLVV